MVPAAHDARGRRCILEAESCKRLQGAGIVVRAGEDEIAARTGQARRLLEQAGIVALDRTQALQQRSFEVGEAGVAQKDGEGLGAGRVLRHAVGLPVVDHLQAMLDAAQEGVGLDELGGCLCRHVPGGGERLQCLDSAACAQRGVAAAEDQLLRLGKELDLADAAASELHIVSQHLDRAAAAMGVDLALDRVDVVDRREVEMLAPDVGPKSGDECLADPDVSRHGMRLDHGGSLPVLADALVVELGRLHRHGQRCRTGIGPQAQVGAEDVSVDRGFGHQLHQQPRRPDEMARRLLVVVDCRRVPVVEQDQVDIARIVELAGAELAHPEHGERGRIGVLADGKLPIAREREEDGIEQRLQALARDRAQRGGDPREWPGPRDVGHGDHEGGLSLQPPQAGSHRLGGAAGSCEVSGPCQLRQDPGQGGVGAGLPQIGHKSGILQSRFSQVRAVAEQNVEQGAGVFRLGPCGLFGPSGPRHGQPLTIVWLGQVDG